MLKGPCCCTTWHLQVLAVLKQVSTELDAAQRHYLAYKQYGDAAERCALTHADPFDKLGVGGAAPTAASLCTTIMRSSALANWHQLHAAPYCTSVDVHRSSLLAAYRRPALSHAPTV